MAGRPREFDEDDVLDQAIEIFWERGYSGTSMSDIARATGLGRQSLYNTFGDKEQLFAKALARYRDVALAKFVDRVSAPDADLVTLRSAFTDLARAHGRSARGCLLLNTTMEAGPSLVGPVAASHLDTLAIAFEQALARSQSGNDIREDVDPPRAANLLVALVAGLHVMGRSGVAEQRLTDAVEAAFAQLV